LIISRSAIFDMVVAEISNTSLDSRRFVALDGLRGVAALMVVAFHSGRFFGVWVPRFGYLAVDLFFLLSGFVLALNYERRFRSGMTAADFLVARIVRLYPLYFLGLMLGTCAALFGLNNPDIPLLSLRDLTTNLAFNLIGLPSPLIVYSMPPVPTQQFLFVLNIPFWSLFFEFWVANILFASLRNLLGWKVLLSIVLLGAAGLLVSEKIFYSLSGGAMWDSFASGLARVAFSFFGGIALAKLHAQARPRFTLPFWVAIASLPVLLAVQLDGRFAHIYELACVIIAFPLLIYFSAQATDKQPWLGVALGDASYAAYTVHVPLWILASWTISKLSIQPSWELQVIFVLLVAGLAWGLNLVDMRIRMALSRLIRHRRALSGQPCKAL
jgi:peptidoglycan/LPS O-acetylase OafA/YrhL